MSSADLVRHIQTVFEEQELTNGQTDHRGVASALVGNVSSLKPNIEREILHMPTQEHLYEGAEETLRHLLESNDKQDRIIIWTQGNPTGQLWKLAMSGISQLRHTYGRDRFGVHAAEDKIATLPELLNELAQLGSQRVIVVDDKAKNIVKVDQAVSAWQKKHSDANLTVIPIWINQGRTQNQVPEDHTLESFTERYQTITDIRQLPRMQDSHQQTIWLIDWDHTLNETAAAKLQLFQNIATKIETAHPEPILGSHVLDLQARIVGATSITNLPNGMSGRRVLDVQHGNGAVVVKHAPNSPKMVAEIRGIGHLQQMPHAKFMPRLHHASENDGIISMEKIAGDSGRDKLQQGSLTEQDVYHIDTVVDMEIRWISDIVNGQKTVPPDMQLRSMQREEFDDTKSGILHAIQSLSAAYGISPEALSFSPIFFEGHIHQSLTEALRALDIFYQATEHDPRIPLHGDISWGNMIFGTNSLHIIDGEWTGLHDPAEAYTRTAKVISTTTAPKNSLQGNLKEGMPFFPHVIQLDINYPFSQNIQAIQEHMLIRGLELARATNDRTFMNKLYMYLAGSYARELAIAERRGMGPDEQVFALKRFVEMVELSQSI